MNLKNNVHPIGIGTWGVGGGMTANSRNDKRDIEAIRYSIEEGQNQIDTAELYGAGHSEEVVGEAIKGFDRAKLFIASKIWNHNATTTRIPKATKKILERLGIEYLDLLYIHACWREGDIPDYITGLNRAQDRGLTKAIGVSNFTLEQLKKAVKLTKHPIVAIQNHYNLTHQSEVDDKMKNFCKKNKITIVAYSPLEGSKWNIKIRKIAKKYKKTPAQIAINWLISQDNVVTIPKSTDKKHIDENLGAMDFEMEDKDTKMLGELA